MKVYEEVYIDLVWLRVEDVITASPGGVDFGDSDLGWGE